jgi:two-component system response regulator HydG
MYLKPRILVVDDDVDNCEMLPIWLDRQQNKYDITTGYSCREARELTVQRRFDLYILDYLMPDMTGAELVHTIRALDANGRIIVFTGLATAAARNAVVVGGCDYFFEKPNDLDLLHDTVEQMFAGRRNSFVPRRPQRSQPGSVI